jgi:hypothetical protein
MRRKISFADDEVTSLNRPQLERQGHDRRAVLVTEARPVSQLFDQRLKAG